ncbi:MAG: aldehyde dehydrogenase (NADP(+)), partial [Saprospiraceae bacterium]|nr:aldehyde dehydrogenase (NADP(+)) [Saprospiraceae bacterium]
MILTGSQLIGFSESRQGQESYHSISPQDNTVITDVEFVDATGEEINRAVQLAESAFDGYRSLTKEQRADFLDAIADQILSIGDQLISKCHSETALPEGRLIGERGRTMNQLRLFAEVVRQGQWVDARIDRADPDRQPIPKADIRSMLIPLGPVAVFGASNFPLAFSVAGGDTASALAAGCPVVFKAHPAHPATSELVGRAIVEAARQTAMPDGVFSMVHGRSHAGGIALVKHPLIRAVGFTGSQSGGLALFKIANAREEPIPVYAEMGSVNPVFILPGAMRARAKSIASGLAKSINLGVGQFCTNPGLVIAEKNDDLDGFLKILDEEIRNSEAGTMLTSGIFQSFEAGKKSLSEHEGVKLASEG